MCAHSVYRLNIPFGYKNNNEIQKKEKERKEIKMMENLVLYIVLR